MYLVANTTCLKCVFAVTDFSEMMMHLYRDTLSVYGHHLSLSPFPLSSYFHTEIVGIHIEKIKMSSGHVLKMPSCASHLHIFQQWGLMFLCYFFVGKFFPPTDCIFHAPASF